MYNGFMCRVAETIILTEKEQFTIDAWAKSKKMSFRIVQRARIIQMASNNYENQEISAMLKISRPTVQLWRERFLALRLAGLGKDAPRPGRIPRVSHKKVRAIVNATLHTTPPDATHLSACYAQAGWSTRTMAKEQRVSNATVQRIWKEHNLKPHLVETFKLSRDKRFLEKLYDVVGLYLNPPDKALVLCVDEKSQIQALERTQPLLPLRPGHSARQAKGDARDGKKTLIRGEYMLDGTVISRCRRRHRHQEYLHFLKEIDANVPKGLAVHLIVDNYATHKHPRAQRWMAADPPFH